MRSGRVALIHVAAAMASQVLMAQTVDKPAFTPRSGCERAPGGHLRSMTPYAHLDAWPIEERPDGTLLLKLTIEPDQDVHLFAPGQTGYLAPTLTPSAGTDIQPWRTVRVELPPGEPLESSTQGDLVRGYRRPFTLMQVVEKEAPGSGKPGEPLAARFRYQACSNRVCFKPETATVVFCPLPPGSNP